MDYLEGEPAKVPLFLRGSLTLFSKNFFVAVDMTLDSLEAKPVEPDAEDNRCDDADDGNIFGHFADEKNGIVSAVGNDRGNKYHVSVVAGAIHEIIE